VNLLNIKLGDTVIYRLDAARSKAHDVRWSEPVTIAKFVRPKVMLLANPETGVIVRKAHVSQIKAYVE
jgi:hypothetical protein